MESKKLEHAAKIIQGLYDLLPNEYTDDTEMNLFESKENFFNERKNNPELLEEEDICDAYFIEGTNIIDILYYKESFNGLEGDIHLIFTILHEMRHMYQERCLGTTPDNYKESGEYDDNEYEKDSNKFAVEFINLNSEKIGKLIGCKEFKIELC